MIDPVAKAYLECVAGLAERASSLRRNLRDAERRAASAGFALPSLVAARAKVDGALADIDEALPLLRRARIFSLSEEVFRAAWRRATSGDLVGTPDLSALPFDVCWFGCPDQDVFTLLGSPPDDERKPRLSREPVAVTRSGVVISPAELRDGWVVVGSQAVGEDGTDPHAVPLLWACALLVDLATSRSAPVRVSGLAASRLMDRAGKHGARPVPPDLYMVHLDARRAGHAIGQVVASRAGPGYRFEVRGHPRLLVRRGAWPDEDAARFWRRRGYEVARGDRLTPEWCREMENRGVAPGRGCEWVALRIVQVREHERGPDGPVVPATRTA